MQCVINSHGPNLNTVIKESRFVFYTRFGCFLGGGVKRLFKLVYYFHVIAEGSIVSETKGWKQLGEIPRWARRGLLRNSFRWSRFSRVASKSRSVGKMNLCYKNCIDNSKWILQKAVVHISDSRTSRMWRNRVRAVRCNPASLSTATSSPTTSCALRFTSDSTFRHRTSKYGAASNSILNNYYCTN